MRSRHHVGLAGRFLAATAFPRVVLAALLALVATATAAQAQVNFTGSCTVSSYRWTLQEDNTYAVTPGVPAPDPSMTASLSFHQSYMRVVAQGTSANLGPMTAILNANAGKRYYISVLPDSGCTNGGGPISSTSPANIVVYPMPLPTAQISIFVFHDNYPVNSAPDLPEEPGLEGFTIQVEDAGGRYGASAGQLIRDAFGYPLGTTYRTAPTPGSPPSYGCTIPDETADPMIPGGPMCVTIGSGTVTSDADGRVLLKNLPPGKYGITVVPPAGQGWVQTSTIEGTKIIDAWVNADEPPFFQEFGTPGFHVFVGFTKECSQFGGTNCGSAAVPFPAFPAGTAKVSGQVVNMHMDRPPSYAMFPAAPFAHTSPIIGLNEFVAGGLGGRQLYLSKTDGGAFEIPNVPAGTYQLAIFDEALDLVFAAKPFTVADGETLNLGEIGVFNWFAAMHNFVFLDHNENGIRDAGEEGIPNTPVNIRWRDGTIYQSAPTDGEGFVPFDEVFPFFSWLVAEIDFAQPFKATGVTVVVDAGGQVTTGGGWAAAAGIPSEYEGVLNPQLQGTGASHRTEMGPVLTQGFQAFLGQTNVFSWGKHNYEPNQNGGISGVVHYSTTRAENDPRYGNPEVWEPGIPDVQVVLYQDSNNDGVIDAVDDVAGIQIADVDNFPFCWTDPTSAGCTGTAAKGSEDVDWDGDSVFDLGDAIQVVHTDSWDANRPAGCVQNEPGGFRSLDCYDGLRNFNQVRPAVFDGGYAFTDIPAGGYIVRVVPPPGYDVVKEEDKNVDFGVEWTPADAQPLAAAAKGMVAAAATEPLAFPACVGGIDVAGPLHTVPPYLDLFPDMAVEVTGIGPDEDLSIDGVQRPTCDSKSVLLRDQTNGAANFFLFTKAPIAGQIFGRIVDDTANEFDPASPQFGEKYAPPFVPISIRDWTGKEVNRVYSDQYGVYNALVPGTYSANLPMPSGMSPTMVTACLNDPMLPDGVTRDPYFNPQYSLFCYTFQYMPGTTTYLDTPVVSVAAFTGPDQFPLDCEFPTGTPVIANSIGHQPNNVPMNGPYVAPSPTVPGKISGQITLTSPGAAVAVKNPAYDPAVPDSPQTVTRDYGFGSGGTVKIGGADLPASSIVSWTPAEIVVQVPYGTQSGELTITRSDTGQTTPVGLTVTVAPTNLATSHVNHINRVRTVGAAGIQAAIDAANPGDLILVPGGRWSELPIMHKPVRLQGSGAGTMIDAVKVGDKLGNWRKKVEAVTTTLSGYLIPGQEPCAPNPLGPPCFQDEEGAGVFVLGRAGGSVPGAQRYGTLNEGYPVSGANAVTNTRSKARIDGFTVTSSDNGGGIVVNGNATNLEIANNRIINNAGVFGGGIRVGHPDLTNVAGDAYSDANNDNVSIHHNMVASNGTIAGGGAGGGISILTGADGYGIVSNFVCGNFTVGEGGGIAHLGLSRNGTIEANAVLFNESFNQGLTVSGGGIFVGGQTALVPGTVGAGSGAVTIADNLIQGNLAGAGDGGGLRVARTNRDKISIFDNVIVNNMAGLAGGGISLYDAAQIEIVHNTIAHNDSLGTAGESFSPGNPSVSNPAPAGIVAHEFTPALKALNGVQDEFPTPKPFANNIIWQNRAFHYGPFADQTKVPNYGLLPENPTFNSALWDYWDMDVLPFGAGQLNPIYSVVTDPARYPGQEGSGATFTNTGTDPGFVASYFTGGRKTTIEQPEGISLAVVLDEGGNFIRPRVGPLTLKDPDQSGGIDTSTVFFGNYHVTLGQPGQPLVAPSAGLSFDFDGQKRWDTLFPSYPPDRGADQICVPGSGIPCAVTYPVPTPTTSPLPRIR